MRVVTEVAIICINILVFCESSNEVGRADNTKVSLVDEPTFFDEYSLDQENIDEQQELIGEFGSDDMLRRNFVEKILRNFLEKLRKRLSIAPPVISQVPIDRVEFDNVKLSLKLENFKVLKAEQFNVEKITNKFYYLTEFKFSFPELQLESQYETDGVVAGAKVNGKGYATVWLKNVVTWGKIYCNFKRGRVNIYRFNFDYSVEDLKANIPGLKVEGKTDEEVAEIVKTQLLPAVVQNEGQISDIVARTAQEKGNAFLRNYSLKRLIQLIQRFKP